jgi:hypothetical protein
MPRSRKTFFADSGPSSSPSGVGSGVGSTVGPNGRGVGSGDGSGVGVDALRLERMLTNFTRLVLGCVEAKFCKKIFV